MFLAYTLIVVEPGARSEVAAALRTLPQLVTLDELNGPYDLLAKVEVLRVAEFGDLVHDHIRRHPKVRSATMLVASWE